MSNAPNTPAKRRWFWRVAIFAVLSVGGFVVIVAPFIGCAGGTRHTAQRNACINVLKQIDAAKEQWARATYQPNDAPPDIEQIDDYIHGGHRNCPAGGTYTYGNVGEPPRCTIKNHTLR
jgi:hypothetical protein